ncbi:MAG: MoaD/ThiS family protein [Methylococcales bacterium]|nr:MoaD/ThiS family protein [Methylococcales bacterium]
MAIKIIFFARLRELSGHAELTVSLPVPTTPRAVWQHVLPDLALPEPLLVAIDQNYAQLDSPVQDGQEVAFFPPVTGG